MKTLNILEEHEIKMLEETITFFLLNQSFAKDEDAILFAKLLSKLQGKYSCP